MQKNIWINNISKQTIFLLRQFHLVTQKVHLRRA